MRYLVFFLFLFACSDPYAKLEDYYLRCLNDQNKTTRVMVHFIGPAPVLKIYTSKEKKRIFEIGDFVIIDKEEFLGNFSEIVEEETRIFARTKDIKKSEYRYVFILDRVTGNLTLIDYEWKTGKHNFSCSRIKKQV